MVDHHVDEFMLVSRQLAALAEAVEGLLRCGAIQPHQGAHKEAKTSLLRESAPSPRRADTGFAENALELARSVAVSGSFYQRVTTRSMLRPRCASRHSIEKSRVPRRPLGSLSAHLA